MHPTSLRNETLERFLERLAATDPTPGGCGAAAVATPMAAALRAAGRLVDVNGEQGDLGRDWCHRATGHVARAETARPATDWAPGAPRARQTTVMFDQHIFRGQV